MDLNASQAGITALKHGGNAIDAAVATASALGVTIPFVAGPGGGGFMVIYLAKTHQVVTIDGRENCPAACTPTMFTGHGQPLGYDYASDQPLATGVPSMVDFGMSLPAALAAPRVSQTNSKTSLAEPLFYTSALAQQLTSQFGEQFSEATGPILPLDEYPGDATALQELGSGRMQAIAEPVRLGGGSALVVSPSR